jgi:hypothetical protein
VNTSLAALWEGESGRSGALDGRVRAGCRAPHEIAPGCAQPLLVGKHLTSPSLPGPHWPSFAVIQLLARLAVASLFLLSLNSAQAASEQVVVTAFGTRGPGTDGINQFELYANGLYWTEGYVRVQQERGILL